MVKTKVCIKCKKRRRITLFRRCRDKRNNKTYTRPDCNKCEAARSTDNNLKKRLLVLNHYGHRCNWPGCEITELAFLTTDHINNDGSKCRKIFGQSYINYWLVKNNFPPGFQILCWNHQHLKQLRVNVKNNKLGKKVEYNRNRYHRLLILVISHYGGCCACCGETNIDLLTIDHICSGGNRQKKKLGGVWNFYCWLIKNNFPPGFQVLCHNCNDGKNVNGGICPHKNK